MTVHVAHHTREISRLGDHLDVFLAIEQEAQAAPHYRVIVGEHDPDRQLRAWGVSRAR